MKRIRMCFRDISNWFFLRKIIRDNNGTEAWLRHGINAGWGATMYTVINLPPEVIESEQALWKLYVIDKISIIDDYFIELGINEIVVPEMDELIDKKAGIYAYGVRFVPRMRHFTWKFIITWAVIIAAAVVCWRITIQ